MIETPEILTTLPQLTAVIHLTVPRAEIRTVMGPGISELMATVASQGIQPTGPWFNRFFQNPADVFDFEISVPVPVPVTAAGRVKPSELPAARVARTVYQGPYEGLADAWGEFEAWIVAQGLKSAPGFWECYVAGPESGPDSSQWRTQFNRTLVD